MWRNKNIAGVQVSRDAMVRNTACECSARFFARRFDNTLRCCAFVAVADEQEMAA